MKHEKVWMCKCDEATCLDDHHPQDNCSLANHGKVTEGVFLPTPEYRALLGVVRAVVELKGMAYKCRISVDIVDKALEKYDKVRGK